MKPVDAYKAWQKALLDEAIIPERHEIWEAACAWQRAKGDQDDKEECQRTCKHAGRRFFNTLNLPVCSDCFAILVTTQQAGEPK